MMKNDEIINIEIPNQVEFIISELEAHGHQAFAVGGCVRDSVLKKEPNDWDITTSALPHEVKGLFHRTIDTGILHGTVTVLLAGVGYEVTTFRIDGEYEDNRRPKSVSYTSDLAKDLERRDFTINAMAYSKKEGLIDLYGGLLDIKDKVIRCVGDPYQRFEEDALRILRAVRFAAQLGYGIDAETKKAAFTLSPNLLTISKERINNELDKLLLSNNPQMFEVCYELGITTYIMPWFDKMMLTEQNTPYHKYSVGKHTLKVMENVPNNHYLRWAALLHDVAKPEVKTTDSNNRDHFKTHAIKGEKMAEKIMKELRFDKKTIRTVSKLILNHQIDIENNSYSVRKSVNIIGKDIYPLFIELRKADTLAKSQMAITKAMPLCKFIETEYENIINNNHCTSISELDITGKDIKDLGYQPGQEIGEKLTFLLEEVLKMPELNKKETLIELLKETIL